MNSRTCQCLHVATFDGAENAWVLKSMCNDAPILTTLQRLLNEGQ